MLKFATSTLGVMVKFPGGGGGAPMGKGREGRQKKNFWEGLGLKPLKTLVFF